MSWTSADLPLIYEAANQFVEIITDGLQDSRGVHLETAIGAAGSVAGLCILRAAVAQEKIDLSKLITTSAGQPVLIEKVSEIGVDVSNFMSAFAKSMGMDGQSGWSNPIPEDHQPLKIVSQLTQQFEPLFLDLMKQKKVRSELYMYVAGLAAVRLVSMGANVLNTDIGKSIALTATVAGSKTVPHN